jgi:hypothetical protein
MAEVSEAQVAEVLEEALAATPSEAEIVVVEERKGHPVLKGLGALLLLGLIAAAVTAIVQRGSSDEDWNAA